MHEPHKTSVEKTHTPCWEWPDLNVLYGTLRSSHAQLTYDVTMAYPGKRVIYLKYR